MLLKLFVYGDLARRIEPAPGRGGGAQRRGDVAHGTACAGPKAIADFRKENGAAIRKACARFVDLCRRVGVLGGGCVAIDGSKFKAVNHRDRNFTAGKAGELAHMEGEADTPIDGRREWRRTPGDQIGLPGQRALAHASYSGSARAKARPPCLISL